MKTDLRKRLLARQSKEELERKADKARRRNRWTTEELDLAERSADELYKFFKWDDEN